MCIYIQLYISPNLEVIFVQFIQVNISLIVNDSESEQCVRALHYAFFESDISEMVDRGASGNGSSTGH